MTTSQRTCAHCGGSFVPGKFQKRMIYCGKACYTAVRKALNPQKCRENYQRNREKRRQGMREWHAKNRDKILPVMRERRLQTRLNTPWSTLFGGAKHRAKVAGLAFDLTHEWAAKRWTGRCELSGIPFKLGLLNFDKRMYAPSIDRIRPEVGYTQDNCRFILFAINCMRQSGTDEEMYEIAQELISNRFRTPPR